MTEKLHSRTFREHFPLQNFRSHVTFRMFANLILPVGFTFIKPRFTLQILQET